MKLGLVLLSWHAGEAKQRRLHNLVTCSSCISACESHDQNRGWWSCLWPREVKQIVSSIEECDVTQFLDFGTAKLDM